MSASVVAYSSAAIVVTHSYTAALIAVGSYSVAAAVMAHPSATSATSATSAAAPAAPAFVMHFRTPTSTTATSALLALSSASRFAFAVLLSVQRRDAEREARCKREQSN